MEDIINSVTTDISEKTTLGELLSILNPSEKLSKAPTPRKLQETAGEPVAISPDPLGYGKGCLVYSNGYAVYDNGSGRTVLWLPDCLNFTFTFVKPKDSEIGIVPASITLQDDLLASQPWAIPVILVGEHRIDKNVMNRTGSRIGTKDLDSDDTGDKVKSVEERIEESLRKAYTWYDGYIGEDPLEYVLRKERQQKMLEHLTNKQRQVFTLYYRDGLTQREVSELMNLRRTAVKSRLVQSIKKIKKIL